MWESGWIKYTWERGDDEEEEEEEEGGGGDITKTQWGGTDMDGLHDII